MMHILIKSKMSSAFVTVAVLLAGCAHGENEERAELMSVAEDSEKTIPTLLDPLGLSEPSVRFYRKSSNACPGTEGEEMWFATLEGNNSVRVTYGVRFKGSDTNQVGGFSLSALHRRDQELFCTGDGTNLDFEPFIISIEVI